MFLETGRGDEGGVSERQQKRDVGIGKCRTAAIENKLTTSGECSRRFSNI
jgi:hypothetical protein